MSRSSEESESDMDDISSSLITALETALRDLTQVSALDFEKILRRIAIKIRVHHWPLSECHKVTDLILSFLSQKEPHVILERRCTGILIAVGIQSPDVIVDKLLGFEHLPPRSLFLAVKEICNYDGSNKCTAQLWDYILRVLQMNPVEKDMFAIYAALSAVVSCVRRHLNVKAGTKEELVSLEQAAIKSCVTFQLLRDHWSLDHQPEVIQETLQLFGNLVALMPVSSIKDQTDWLIEQLTHLPIDMTPYIQECVFQLLHARLVGETGGFDRKSQVDRILFLLLNLVNLSSSGSDRSLIWRSLSALIALCSDWVFQSLLRDLQSGDADTIDLALTVFTNVLPLVLKTERARSDLLRSVIALIRQDITAVRDPVLQLIELLNRQGCLVGPQGNHFILELIQLTFFGRSVAWDFRRKISAFLNMISLPQLVTVLCQPENYAIIVPMSTILLEKALLAQSLGNIPYLSSFQQNPAQFISPQKLLLHLVVLAARPFRVKELGVRCIELLAALQPLTTITYRVQQVCQREVPELLDILNDNDEHSLQEESWENRLLEFSQGLIPGNDQWLEPLLQAILELRDSEAVLLPQKAFLYKFFGCMLRASRGQRLVSTMVFSLLQTSHQDPEERKGIAVALRAASRSHLKTVVEQLLAYGAVLTDQNSSAILSVPKKHQQREWLLALDTIYSSFGSVIRGSRSDIAKYANDILAFCITTYKASVIGKDTNMKLDYLDALSKITTALCNVLFAQDNTFPSTLELERLLMTILEEEPTEALSSAIRLKAINVIVHLRALEDFSVRPEETAAVLQTCLESVLCLPSPYSLPPEPFVHREHQVNVDLYMSTLESLLLLMRFLVEDTPSGTEQCLEGLIPWINSKKHYERERALWMASQLFHYVAQNESFQTEITFTKLELLVKLLALRCYDDVDNISLLSAWALCHLHSILQQQKDMRRKKMGSGKEGRRAVTCSAASFYKKSSSTFGRNSAANVAKAFAALLSQTQLTNLVLEALRSVTDVHATVSLSSAQLITGILNERGGDVLQRDHLATEILHLLSCRLEPSTEEELLQAMCWLAGNSPSPVIRIMLSLPLPWNRNELKLWELCVTKERTAAEVLKVLVELEGSREMDLQVIAVSCAILAICSEAVCEEAIQKVYPRLLLALLSQIYRTAKKSSRQEMVVRRHREDGKLQAFDPLSCAISSLRALTGAAGYRSVVNDANTENCWEALASPDSFHLGVMNLTRAIVRNCPQQVIHEILALVVKMLGSQDRGQKLLSRGAYAQLLEHRAAAKTLGQEALSTVMQSIDDPDPVIKEIGAIGMSNLALHPKSAEVLATMTHALKDLVRGPPRLKIQSMKTYRNMIIASKGESKEVFPTVSEELRMLLTDETKEVRLSAISTLGDMLEQINQWKPVSSFKREILTLLVPLLLNLQDDDVHVVKVCGHALEKWSGITKWKSLTSQFKNADPGNNIQVLEDTIKRLIRKRKMEVLGTLLLETFGFLRSPQSFLRTRAMRLVGLVLESLPTIHVEDAEVIKTALETANEFVPDMQQVTAAALAKIDLIPPPKTEKNCLRRLFDLIVPPRPSRLFKSIDDKERDKKGKRQMSTICAWWQKHRGTVIDASHL